MKKTLVILLILAVAGGLFAQDAGTFSWSGGVNTGLRFVYSDETDKGAVDVWHDDAGAAAFNVVGTYDAEAYGFKFKYANSFNGEIADVTNSYAYLWANFFNDVLKLTGGKIDGAAWGSGGAADKSYDGIPGLRFEVKPIDGLNFGFTLTAPIHDKGAYTAEQFFKETAIGVKYTNDAFGGITLAAKLDSDGDAGTAAKAAPTTTGVTDGDGNILYAYPDGTLAWLDPTDPDYATTIGGSAAVADSDKDIRLLFGINLSKLVSGLTLIVDGELGNLGDDDGKYVVLGEKVGYEISDGFTVTLAVTEAGWLKEFSDYASISIAPSVSYKINDAWTAGLDAGIYSTIKDFGDNVGVQIKPSATFTVGDNASIGLSYKAFLGLGKGDVGLTGIADYTPGADDPVPSITKHTVQVNFGWSF